jgi:predicted glutamine amidotransferase
MAILDPERYRPSQIADAGIELYQSMRDGLGIVVIQNRDERFEYSAFKSLDPDVKETVDFLQDEIGDETERVVLHGRLATHGEENIQNCHPLEVECDKCDAEYVLHNGVVYNHELLQSRHEAAGHEYATPVDSEAIVHEHSGVPDSVGSDNDDSEIGVQPAYVICGKKAVYVSSSNRYSMTEDMRMASSSRQFGPSGLDGETTTYREVRLSHNTEDN